MSPNPYDVGIWIGVLALVVSILTNVFTIVNGFRSQRRQVSLQENLATIPQLNKVESDLSGRIERVDGDVKNLKDSIVANGEVRRKNIEAKVESVRLELKGDIASLSDETKMLGREISAVKNNCELTNASVNGLGSKIDRILERRGSERVGI
jgi:uncharacterized coiled-coil DUF342 family protein